MHLKYFMLALGTLFAGQALASPIQLGSALASGSFEVRNGAVEASQQSNQSLRRSSEENAYTYLATRTEAPPMVTPHPHDDTLEMEKRHSAKGKKYHIVRPKGSAKLEAAAHKSGAASLRRRNHFTKTVWWPVGSFGQSNIPFIDDTGIEQWNLGGSPWYSVFYAWRLNFLTEYHLDYGFTDQTGDTYWCSVYISGMHYVDYNSASPSIVQVQA